MNVTGPQYLPRARRVERPSSILYRPVGDIRWREGRTKNFSETGVLFDGAEPIDVEMRWKS